jgi:hypothetical protein
MPGIGLIFMRASGYFEVFHPSSFLKDYFEVLIVVWFFQARAE